MKVILFGATGMIGQGVLRECLAAPDVKSVLAIGRAPTGQRDPKLVDLVHADLFDYSSIESVLTGYDACFFCLGVSSVGMSEAEYTRITHDLTLAAATVLARLNPTMTFIYVSGLGTDSAGQGSTMWARVKGRTENALLALPFKGYMFRPGFIQPVGGITSRTRLYRVLYAVVGPLFPLLQALAPNQLLTTQTLGRAMLHVARSGAPGRVLEPKSLNALAT